MTGQPHARRRSYYRCELRRARPGLTIDDHPTDVYVREDALIQALDHWLEELFAPERVQQTAQLIVEADANTADESPATSGDEFPGPFGVRGVAVGVARLMGEAIVVAVELLDSGDALPTRGVRRVHLYWPLDTPGQRGRLLNDGFYRGVPFGEPSDIDDEDEDGLRRGVTRVEARPWNSFMSHLLADLRGWSTQLRN